MKKIIITGWSDWLGLEISKVLLDKWYQIICLSRTKPNLDVEHIKVDLSKEDDVYNAINKIKDKFSDFDILINCAWVTTMQESSKIQYKDIDNIYKVNVLAPIYLTSGLMDIIKTSGADIVNIWSAVWYKPYDKSLIYSSSKWALRWISENLQLELKNFKSRVISFNPWWINTSFFSKSAGTEIDTSSFMDPKELAKFLVQILELPKNIEVSQVIINRK